MVDCPLFGNIKGDNCHFFLLANVHSFEERSFSAVGKCELDAMKVMAVLCC